MMTPAELRRAAQWLAAFATHMTGPDPADLARKLRAEADERGWRSIDTAPKDGTRILLWHRYRPNSSVIGYWSASHGDWMSDSGELQRGFITHWQPLPPGPTQEHD